MGKQYRYYLLSLGFAVSLVLNATPPPGYYDGINGLKGRALKTVLFSIISDHHNVGYDGLWTVYAESDMRPDGTYWDMYSSTSRFYPGAPSSYKKEGDGINREHTVPQSWFGKGNPMKSDAFHVLPTDGYVNNRRSNFPYGEVNNPTYSSNEGFSKVGPCVTPGYSGTVFEPNDLYKGDLARGYFYMATCYENKISNWGGVFGNGTYPGIVQWQLDMLLRWALNDPVSRKEVDRNEAVYQFQKNRNPFIDFPNLARYVWGDSVAYAFYIDKTVTTFDGEGLTPTPPTPPDEEDEMEILHTTLRESLVPFVALSPDGSEGWIWRSDKNYGAVANAFSGGPVAADEYLLTELDCSDLLSVQLDFGHKTGFNKNRDVSDLFTVLVSTDYTDVPEMATWTKLNVTFPDNSSQTWTPDWENVSIDLSAYAGKKVTLAFRYVSTTSDCYGWEITDVTVKGAKSGSSQIPVIRPEVGEEGDTFDLSGRRVPAHRRGIVIRNGRKILQ